MINACPKPTQPWESNEYRHYVRDNPCCLCQSDYGVVAAHIGSRGMSQKPPDYCCVPLCSECHSREHGAPGYEPLTEKDRYHLVWTALNLCGEFIVLIRAETVMDTPPEFATDTPRKKVKRKIPNRKASSARGPKLKLGERRDPKKKRLKMGERK